jgi:tetratricopeptide (TPR) repeat protein
MCLYELHLPGVLTGVHGTSSGIGYDDGVYLGAAIRLVHGALPYRDFILVHPPGSTLLMAPVAAVGRLVGERDALALARVVTAVVTGLNAALAALVVRHRGPAAMFVAGMALAVFPLAVAADHTLLLEPYVVCFCLLGMVTMFSAGSVAGRQRLLKAGLLFGFAGTIKVWAILPVVAAIVVCLPRGRRALAPLLSGCAGGFLIPTLPFFAAAPGAFMHDVFVAQLTRLGSGTDPYPPMFRLLQMTGLPAVPAVAGTHAQASYLTLVIAVVIGAGYLIRFRESRAADWMVLLASAVVVIAMFVAIEFYDHYAYFVAAFVAPPIGVAAGRLSSAAREAADPILRRLGTPWIPVTAAALCALVLIPEQAEYARTYLADSDTKYRALKYLLPRGGCVLFDQPTDLIVGDRFTPKTGRCPAVVDPFGSWLAKIKNTPPYAGPFPEPFVKFWAVNFSKADYVVLVAPRSNYFPWTPSLIIWFDSNFSLTYSEPGIAVYRHTTWTPPDLRYDDAAAAANAWVSGGIAAEGAGDRRRAFEYYTAATRADPHNAFARFDLGHLYQSGGELGKAQDQYLEALAINPRFPAALYNLGVLLSPTAPSRAIGYYERDLAIEPDRPAANFNLGVLLVHQGKSTRGERFLRIALRLDPALRSKLPAGITLTH